MSHPHVGLNEMTYRICDICEKPVEYDDPRMVVEFWSGEKMTSRKSGHYVCVRENEQWPATARRKVHG